MGGQTITPSTSQQTINTSGKYMTGNVIINRVSPPPANCIKKGYIYMGVTGTWEGYVANPTDLYNHGNNIAGLRYSWMDSDNEVRFDVGQITYNCSTLGLQTTGNYNISGYTKVNFEGSMSFDTGYGNGHGWVEVAYNVGDEWITIGTSGALNISAGSATYDAITVNIKNNAVAYPIRFIFSLLGSVNATKLEVKGYITRIWLS